MNKVRLKYIFNIQKGRLTDEDVNGAILLDVEYLRSGGNPKKVSLANAVYSKGGDLLMLWDGSKAGELLWSKEGVVGSTLVLLEPTKDINTGYAYYFLKSKQSYIQDLSTGMGIPHVDGEILGNLLIDLPGVDKQEAIAMYLDRITAVIDKIITAKNHTHTHLLELRQAIITDAVLGRGGVFMNYRQTNIPWIGKIPAHWQVRRIKDIAVISVGWTPDTNNPDYFNGNNTWVTIADMNQKYVVSSKVKISNEAINSSRIKLVKKGSLLYSFKLSVGKVAFAGKDLYTNEAIAAITPNYNNEVDTSFLYYAVSTYLANNANENIYGAKIMNQDTIRNSYIAFPDINEQLKISRTLDKKVRNIDDAMSINKQSIQLLNEYRSSLISNVINGKVKV